jgi:FixJ family two-component response regulator
MVRTLPSSFQNHRSPLRTDPSPIVFVIEDDPSLRRAIKRLVQSVGLDAETLGSAKEFLSASRPDVPSCIILDVRLPGMSGLDLQRELAAADVHIPIIFITSYGDIPMSVRAMKAGAIEFLPKPFRDQDLLDAVRLALERDRARLQQQADIRSLRERFQSLNKQIAAAIGTSEATVKVHRSQLTRKMAAKSLADLVRMAEKMGVPLQTP